MGKFSENEQKINTQNKKNPTVSRRKILFITGMGFFTDAYDLFIIGIALSLIKPEWHPSTLAISLVSSTALLTSALGATVFGHIADRFGRTKIYGVEVLLVAIGAIATALSPNILTLIILRGLVGFGIGGDYPVSATIMSEYSDSRTRGRMVALLFSMQGLGLIVGPLVAVALLASGISHDLAWRLMLGLGAIPSLIVFQMRRRLPETPHYAKARTELLKKTKKAVATRHTSARQLLSSPNLRRLIIGTAGSWFLLDFAFYGNTISSPFILKLISPHAALIRTTLETLIIFVIAAAPGYILAIRQIDRQGRKSIQAIGFGVMALCFILIGVIPGLKTMVVPFLVLYGLSYFFTQYGPNTTTFVYPTEVFPVRLRTTGHGISAATGKIGAFVGAFLFPILLRSLGLGSTETIVGIVCVAGLLLTITCLPEPKQRELEEIAETVAETEFHSA